MASGMSRKFDELPEGEELDAELDLEKSEYALSSGKFFRLGDKQRCLKEGDLGDFDDFMLETAVCPGDNIGHGLAVVEGLRLAPELTKVLAPGGISNLSFRHTVGVMETAEEVSTLNV